MSPSFNTIIQVVTFRLHGWTWDQKELGYRVFVLGDRLGYRVFVLGDRLGYRVFVLGDRLGYRVFVLGEGLGYRVYWVTDWGTECL